MSPLGWRRAPETDQIIAEETRIGVKVIDHAYVRGCSPDEVDALHGFILTRYRCSDCAQHIAWSMR